MIKHLILIKKEISLEKISTEIYTQFLLNYFSFGYDISSKSVDAKSLDESKVSQDKNNEIITVIRNYGNKLNFTLEMKFILSIFHVDDFSFLIDELIKFENINKERKDNEEKDKLLAKTPSWRVLYGYETISSEEFEEAINNLEAEVSKSEKCSPSIFLHKLSILVFFNENGCHHLSGKLDQYIFDYFSNNDLSEYFPTSSVELKHDGGTGLGYLANGIDYFEDSKDNFIQKFQIEKNKSKEEEKKEEKNKYSQTLIEINNLETKKSCDFIKYSISKGDIELLIKNIDHFAKNILIFSNKDLNKLSTIIDEKSFEISTFTGNKTYLKICLDDNEKELVFWEDLVKKLSASANKNTKFDALVLSDFIKNIQEGIIKTLNDHITEGKNAFSQIEIN